MITSQLEQISRWASFKRNVNTRSRDIKTKVYKALVRPRLEYCSTVWDPHSKCATQRLEMLQRRAARYVLRRYHNTSIVSEIVAHLQWPTLAQRQCCYRLTLLYKIPRNLVAVPSSQYITPHQTSTRSNSLAFLPFHCNTNFCWKERYFISYPLHLHLS